VLDPLRVALERDRCGIAVDLPEARDAVLTAGGQQGATRVEREVHRAMTVRRELAPHLAVLRVEQVDVPRGAGDRKLRAVPGEAEAGHVVVDAPMPAPRELLARREPGRPHARHPRKLLLSCSRLRLRPMNTS